MRTAPRPVLVVGGVLASLSVAGVWSGGAAVAAEGLTVKPVRVAPAGKLTIAGTCPEPVAGPYVRATVAVEALNRYLVVPVRDGAFRTTMHVQPVGDGVVPKPGKNLKLAASCRTSASYVAPVGDASVRVVKRTAATAASAKTNASGPTTGDSSVPDWIPLSAFAVAIVGSLAAYLMSRRHDQRAAAMAGHPAQRGLTPPRRDAK